ncbi:MAG TPA: hypothetical protein VN366_13720 [Feifaniaceae bacterium]|nr:hypothetical protein [Feifaniaceae bacterium]
MKSDLMERYIYAVEKRLPYKQRADIKKELNTLIADMLEQRCGDVPPTEHDVRVVLTELGTPSELAEQYHPDKRRALISQPYYGKYKMVLKIVLLAVAGGLTAAHLILALLGDPPKVPFLRFMEWIGGVFTGELYAFAFVTGIFAFFERKGVKLDHDDALGDLPPVPAKDERIGRGESIAGIFFSIAFLLLFLWLAPWVIGIYSGSGFVPMFNQAALLRMWPVLLLITGAGVIKEIVKLLEGRYTFRVAFTALITGIVSLGLFVLLFSTEELLNPAFLPGVTALFGAEDTAGRAILGSVPAIFLGVVAFAHVLDIITSFAKASRFRRA